ARICPTNMRGNALCLSSFLIIKTRKDATGEKSKRVSAVPQRSEAESTRAGTITGPRWRLVLSTSTTDISFVAPVPVLLPGQALWRSVQTAQFKEFSAAG